MVAGQAKWRLFRSKVGSAGWVNSAPDASRASSHQASLLRSHLWISTCWRNPDQGSIALRDLNSDELVDVMAAAETTGDESGLVALDGTGVRHCGRAKPTSRWSRWRSSVTSTATG